MGVPPMLSFAKNMAGTAVLRKAHAPEDATAMKITDIRATPVTVPLHAPLRHAMRERGLPAWRVRDTLLTSPLFVAGVVLALLAANHGLVRLAVDAHTGASGRGHVAGSAAAVCVGLTMAAFGLRAVRKLF